MIRRVLASILSVLVASVPCARAGGSLDLFPSGSPPLLMAEAEPPSNAGPEMTPQERWTSEPRKPPTSSSVEGGGRWTTRQWLILAGAVAAVAVAAAVIANNSGGGSGGGGGGGGY